MTSQTPLDTSGGTARPVRLRAARGGILVLGGGFAGSYVARGLGPGGATIVNPSNFMLYTPLLPEAAAGTVEPRHVTVPLRTMCPHADLVLGAAVAHDPERRVVEVESEAGRFAIAYADLVVALGAVTRVPPVPGLREHALQLKDLSDAIRLRNHVLRQIELADAAPDDAESRLTFVLAGAGFSGVEAIAELSELAADALLRHPRLQGKQPRWVLVDGAPRILGQAPESLAHFAARTLDRRGIEIVTGTTVRAVDAAGLTLSDGRRIDTRTVVWTAGVAPNPLLGELGLPLDERGRVPVDETLRVAGAPHVWALGDCAAVPNEATPGETDPATCQHALRQARRLARNLRGTPRPYRYRTRGQMATLGRRHGIAVVGKMRVRGLAGWLLARGYHVLQLPFASRRARVLADWVLAATFRRDVAELSTGGVA
ncbi:MAG TPA: NAD(P)/FAD-dependent oxidoreductase [Solirubrobacteraceae bacterium]|nr:NAD(P)/FAD-dependent oxidoreductase [Solirubrobacteraceae bacterium]